jgi:Protein of unknown function (DUF2934)
VKSQHPIANAENLSTSIHPADVPEEKGKEMTTLDEIRQRSFEIHIERGGIHGCDLDDWMQAERELQQKYNKSNDGGPKKK